MVAADCGIHNVGLLIVHASDSSLTVRRQNASKPATQFRQLTGVALKLSHLSVTLEGGTAVVKDAGS
jgi:hypothetical protein